VRDSEKNASDRFERSNCVERPDRRGSLRTRVLTGILVSLVILAVVAPQAYRIVKTRYAQQVAFATLPACQEIELSPGTACVVRLPNRKAVALWCNKSRGIAAVLNESDLTFEYGEAPFKRLQRERVALPNGGITTGDYLSYIRQGPVIESGTNREYVLYVDNYCVSITESSAAMRNSILLFVSARIATEKELVPPKREREHYLQALTSSDAMTRREAIHELGMMVAMGSIYAGNPLEIADAIRPYLKDSDDAVRNEALVRLRVMGDDDALLEMLTPRPIPEFSEPNGAWTIAGWCRRDSDRVPKHVMTYFETDDPKLHEFAHAFFSCYGTSDASPERPASPSKAPKPRGNPDGS
jgi:hypothetical protein